MPRTTVPFTVAAWVATVKLAWGKRVLLRRMNRAQTWPELTKAHLELIEFEFWEGRYTPIGFGTLWLKKEYQFPAFSKR